MTTITNRRNFVKNSALLTAGIAMSASSYARIIGANNRLNFAVAGVNGRGKGLIRAVNAVPDTSVIAVCDVDSKALGKAVKIAKEIGNKPEKYLDVRKLLENKDVDVLIIATPDHWHAPMSIMALQAGKHVYVEKPCCHSPGEGELLIQAAKKYGKRVQMGNQQRSAPTSMEAVADIKDGIIGDVYYGKAWYSNDRGSIGVGKEVPIPKELDWELWQGPAPRKTYKDNWVHYHWHWFWNWGTGEINNNGLHEIDICRWALGVDFPAKVTSSGGRFHFKDDWEFYDTQVASFEFKDNKMITWEGKSCNNQKFLDKGRGATIHGTEGWIFLDRNKYEVYDNKNKQIKKSSEKLRSETTGTMGLGGLNDYHMGNLAASIRQNKELNSPIDEGYKSNLLCHLGNIAQKFGRTLNTDPSTGRILDDTEAMTMWNRQYEPGWEPKI